MLKLNFNNNILDDIKTVSAKDIAIIGIDLKLPQSDNLDEFWDVLANGKDCVEDFPQNRKKDIEDYIHFKNGTDTKIHYANGGYLQSIDQFDNEFFKISNKEANLMDPNQRIFLENAWKAIEDSGYGGSKLIGSRTGVYVGLTPRGEYRKYIIEITPESLTASETGNLSSIVASRIAYIMDFRGPSMIVNTACSSSLVALHLACKGIRNGECDIAIAGGIRLAFSPVITDQKIGIESEQGKVCSFDDDSDGAVFGEGSIAIVLKPLSKAVKDHDNIYGIIKGSAVNQDGASVGITAPNLLAQEDVLIRAWEDADIDPETITYIEAHGTGTKLGDPIEANAITRAFHRYTNKKQFCGLGSVKTNIAHLDNVAGLASLVKVVLALKNKQIPPSINFRKPNRNINFENSALYLNNRLTDWDSGTMPRRCGINSFGLSGTNCHVVLEEAPKKSRNKRLNSRVPELFTISAVKKEAVMDLVRTMKECLVKNKDLCLEDVCYTSNTGRGHYNYRLAILTESIKELISSLEKIADVGMEHVNDPNIMWGVHFIVSNQKQVKDENEIDETEKKDINHETNKFLETLHKSIADNRISHSSLKELGERYVRGGDVDWEALYTGRNCSRVSLPTYPFEKKRCWISVLEKQEKNPSLPKPEGDLYGHPLIHRLVIESVDQDIYITDFNVSDHWVLQEHNIRGKYLLPGTAFLEMAYACGKKYFEGEGITYKNVLFLNSLIVNKGEHKRIQTVMKKKKGCLEFQIAGKAQEKGTFHQEWIIYCEGKLYPVEAVAKEQDSFDLYQSRCMENIEFQKPDTEPSAGRDFEFGKRWSSITQSIHAGNDEVFVELVLPDEFRQDLNEYYIHPSMADMAVNAITQSTGNGIYLPLSYGTFTMYAPIKKVLYSYVKRINSSNNLEIMNYNVCLFDEEKKLIASIENLSTKRLNLDSRYGERNSYDLYHITYKEEEITAQPHDTTQEVLVFCNKTKATSQLLTALLKTGRKVVTVSAGTEYSKISEEQYMVGNSPQDYRNLFEDIKNRHIRQILHLFTVDADMVDHDVEELEKYQEKGVYNLFHIAKAIANCHITDHIDFVVVSDRIRYVVEGQTEVHAHNAPLVGLSKVVNNEFSNIKCRVLDVDEFVDEETIVHEINAQSNQFYTAYRQNRKYIEILSEIELPETKDFRDGLKEEGTYIITGGMGGLGVETAKYLSSQKKINLVFIGRKALPAFTEWEMLKEKEDAKLNRSMEIVTQIKESGSSVAYYCADVSNKDIMADVLDKIRVEYGSINGIIHAAGVASEGYMINKSLTSFQSTLLPKVHGTYLLDKLTEDDNLDFFVLFSSISSLYGYAGQGDYVAANSYLDSFSEYRRLKNKKTLSINWAPWKDTGMAYDYGLSDDGIFKMLPVSAALEAFQLAMGCELDHVIIGKLNYEVAQHGIKQLPFRVSEQLYEKIERSGSVNTKKRSAEDKKRSVTVKGKKDTDYSEMEITLANIWGNTLEMNDVDIYSSFIELGGDSILAIELLKELENVYPGIVSISDIFSYPSVIEMSHFIEGKIEPKEKPSDRKKPQNDMVDLLSKLEDGELSVDEVETMLANDRKE